MKADRRAEAPDIPFLTHLEELRRRIIRSLIAVSVGFLVAYSFSDRLLTILARPLLPLLPSGRQTLVFTGVVEPFMAQLKVGLIAGFFLSCPYFFWQAWQFIAPGLNRRERRLAILLVSSASLFFIGGALFGYFLALPAGFSLLLSLGGTLMLPMIAVGDYVQLASQLLLAFGVVFELPLLLLLLTALGVVTPRAIARQWRYLVFGIAFLSAALTPPDVGSMMIMMLPLLALFLISLGLSFLVAGRRPPSIFKK